MATTTNFSVRMDSDIKKQCEAMYGELGINLTTAINVFLRPVSAVFLLMFAWSSRTRKRWQQCWKQNALLVIRL